VPLKMHFSSRFQWLVTNAFNVMTINILTYLRGHVQALIREKYTITVANILSCTASVLCRIAAVSCAFLCPNKNSQMKMVHCAVVPVKTLNQLLITWPLPSQIQNYRFVVISLMTLQILQYFASFDGP